MERGQGCKTMTPCILWYICHKEGVAEKKQQYEGFFHWSNDTHHTPPPNIHLWRGATYWFSIFGDRERNTKKQGGANWCVCSKKTDVSVCVRVCVSSKSRKGKERGEQIKSVCVNVSRRWRAASNLKADIRNDLLSVCSSETCGDKLGGRS